MLSILYYIALQIITVTRSSLTTTILIENIATSTPVENKTYVVTCTKTTSFNSFSLETFDYIIDYTTFISARYELKRIYKIFYKYYSVAY